MKQRLSLVLVLLLAALSIQGCGSGAANDEGSADCGAMLQFASTAFRPIVAQQMPVRGEPLGQAGYLGCDGSPAPRLGKVDVFAVDGADHTQAVIAAPRGSDVFYVAKDTPESQWPAVVRTVANFPRCTQPTTFQGSWDLLLADNPGGGRFSGDLPYVAVFTAHSGDDIDTTAWASVTIQATVTEDTDPVPSVETAKAAIGDHEPVTVSAVCRGDAFEVAHLELTD